MERLQKVIANAGYCSRRKAEEEIIKGHVMVNGEVVRKMGVLVSPTDEIIVNGTLIKKEEKEYVLLNKPRGVVTTTSDDKNRKTVLEFIDTDELLEITPQSLRIRKKILDPTLRKRASFKK